MTSGEGEVFGVAADVRIHEHRRKRNLNSNEFVGVIDDDLHVDPSMLQKYCFASPSSAAVDFVTVLAAVRFADRAVKRRHSVAWARRIQLSIPVSDTRRWSSSRVLSRLHDCLNYLTGDIWQLEFSKRRSVSKFLSAGHTPHLVPPPDAPYVGIPYSDGLDSYAQATLLRDREP